MPTYEQVLKAVANAAIEEYEFRVARLCIDLLDGDVSARDAVERAEDLADCINEPWAYALSQVSEDEWLADFVLDRTAPDA